MAMTRRTAILALLLLAGCGSAVPSATSGPTTTAATPLRLLRVETGGGLVAPDFVFRQLPTLVVYGDGVVITQGPQAAIFPGPALPNLIERQLDAAGLATLTEALRDAGLLTATPPSYELNPITIADAPTTTLTVTVGNVTAVHSAYALGMVVENGARKKLADFVARLGDLSAVVGGSHLGKETSYVPTSFRVRATPNPSDGGVQPRPEVIDWPLATVDLARATTCAPVTAIGARALFASMTETTRVRQAGSVYAIAIRQVLPGEAACPGA